MNIKHDVPYLPGREAALLDIHYPASFDQGALFPGIVVIHGGGWRVGDKAQERQQQMATLMAEHDYVVINVNYSLAPTDVEDRAPYISQAFEECRQSLQWFVANAESLKLDPKRIGTIGGSAGGHMALMLALTAEHPDFLKPGEQIIPIGAVVNLYAPATRPAGLEPVNFMNEQCPPVLTYHGTADKIVDVSEAYALDECMQKLNLNHEMHIIEGAPHTFNMNSEWGEFGPHVAAFFNQHLKNT